MKLGQLADMLRELAEAEQHVKDCEQAIRFGGNEETLKHKREALLAAESNVRLLRYQDLPRI